MRSFVLLACLSVSAAVPFVLGACDRVNTPVEQPQTEADEGREAGDVGDGGVGPTAPAPTITASPSDIEI